MRSVVCISWLALLMLQPNLAVAQLSALSDEFDDSASLSNWQRFHTLEGWPDKMLVADVDQTVPGALYLEPSSCGWFNDLHAPFLFKEVTGDFIVETRVLAQGRSTAVPTTNYSLAGLFVRAPRSITKATWTPGGEDWMFLSVGRGTANNVLLLEDKTTMDSQSTLRLTQLAVIDWVELRIARTGDQFQLDYRIAPGSWIAHQSFSRPDLPATLQVGFTAYTDWPTIAPFEPDPFTGNCQVLNVNADLLVHVDYVRFSDLSATAAPPVAPTVRLRQNVPNPFNPSTAISFELAAPSFATLDILAPNGRRVRRLLAAPAPAGTTQLNWDGRDAKGLPVASGVYVARLVTASGVTRRVSMTLLR